MKKSITCILLICTVLGLHSIKIHAGEQKNDSLLLMWWNVENLFDTHNDPDVDDEEFTPEGRNHWTQKKLALKRLRIKQVLDSIDT